MHKQPEPGHNIFSNPIPSKSCSTKNLKTIYWDVENTQMDLKLDLTVFTSRWIFCVEESWIQVLDSPSATFYSSINCSVQNNHWLFPTRQLNMLWQHGERPIQDSSLELFCEKIKDAVDHNPVLSGTDQCDENLYSGLMSHKLFCA